VIVVDEVQPPQTAGEVARRLRNMRLQPDFERHEWRTQQIRGLASAGGSGEEERFSKLAILVMDEDYACYDNPDEWESNLAKPELDLVTRALSTGQAMEKITQFAPQIAAQGQQQAVLAIVLSLIVIVGYLWVRFQSVQFGLAGIMSLVHDVCVTLGLVVFTDLIAGTPIGRALGFEQTGLRIDMTMIAAFLTIIGYSLNDTIVVFDRIRENRGRLTTLSEPMINASINQCLSRTLLTGVTTLLVLVVMYFGGGSGIRGFSFSMFVGIITGTYSSIGVASALLMRPKALYTLTLILVAAGMGWLLWQVNLPGVRYVGLGMVVILAALAIYKVRVGGQPSALAAGR